MRQLVDAALRRALRRLGYDVRRRPSWPRDFGPAEIGLYRDVAPYTMTSPDALWALAESVRYVCANEIPGAIVECGVWKGGSMMAAARVLLELGRTDIDLYLFDTFAGMPEPTDADVLWTGQSARFLLAREKDDSESLLNARASLEQVRAAMGSTPYPSEKIHFVKGRVEDTIPQDAPDEISLLRLDTDWYESTRHELVHLYPRLASGGVLLLDDYGWWQGARKATDEYFRDHVPAPLLVRIDDGGVRLAVKPMVP